jgi:hypothetical protein
MHRIFYIFLAVIVISPFTLAAQSSMEILEKSISVHDPDSKWKTAKLSLHFEEPRIGNPYRYSRVKLDNTTGAFEMLRSRDEYISTHIIDENGVAVTLLDGEIPSDTSLIRRHRLDPSRNTNYRSYYDGFCGLPMNLPGKIKAILETEEVIFNGQKCFMIEIKLKEAMFSDHWRIYIDAKSYLVKGLDFILDEAKMEGERLYFDQIFDLDGIKLTRMRHWYDLKDDTYLGSDILVTKIE